MSPKGDMLPVASEDVPSGSAVKQKSPSRVEVGESMSAMDTDKDLAYQQTLRNHSKEVRLGLRQGKEMVGRRALLLLEQRAGAGAKGSPREHSSNGEDTSAGTGTARTQRWRA